MAIANLFVPKSLKNPRVAMEEVRTLRRKRLGTRLELERLALCGGRLRNRCSLCRRHVTLLLQQILLRADLDSDRSQVSAAAQQRSLHEFVPLVGAAAGLEECGTRGLAALAMLGLESLAMTVVGLGPVLGCLAAVLDRKSVV
jgi:hypothetical protein